jgi:hypothetical protein
MLTYFECDDMFLAHGVWFSFLTFIIHTPSGSLFPYLCFSYKMTCVKLKYIVDISGAQYDLREAPESRCQWEKGEAQVGTGTLLAQPLLCLWPILYESRWNSIAANPWFS